ncbi:MAG: histone deacetylase [Armatimonadota bacterium]|nr:histone deacetylase [Armatimonadota bacterium]MDW8155699.1 histone deacetylase [Armatimonadota bacterium]
MIAFDTSTFSLPLPPGHPFPVGKYSALRQALHEAGCGSLLAEAPRAPRVAVEKVHDPGYVDRVLSGRLTPEEQRCLGLPPCRELTERALRTCGATLAAARTALRHGVAVALGGGGHHADRHGGRGFCVFNDVAVAAADARAHGVRRVLVVDCDVHQGDGTALLFAGDDGVYTLDMYARGNRMRSFARSRWEVVLEDGVGDGEYLAALQAVLPAILNAVRPQLVLYVAGADPLAGDRFGRLRLTEWGLRARDEFVLGEVCGRGVPVAVTLGGGYGRPVEHTVRVHRNTVLAAVRQAGKLGQVLGAEVGGG